MPTQHPRGRPRKPRTEPEIKRPRGRPLTLSQQVIDDLVAGIRVGLSTNAAAARANVPDTTLRHWLAVGEQHPDSIHGELVRAMANARATGELVLLAKIQRASESDWKAAAWILERRHPESYARVNRHEVSGPTPGAPVALAVSSWADLVRRAQEPADPDEKPKK
jgi:hypothetical protein